MMIGDETDSWLELPQEKHSSVHIHIALASQELEGWAKRLNKGELLRKLKKVHQS